MLRIRLIDYEVLVKFMIGDMLIVDDTVMSTMWYIRKVIFWVIVN